MLSSGSVCYNTVESVSHTDSSSYASFLKITDVFCCLHVQPATSSSSVDFYAVENVEKHVCVCALPPPVGVVKVPSKGDETEGVLDPFDDLPPQPAMRVHTLHLASTCRPIDRSIKDQHMTENIPGLQQHDQFWRTHLHRPSTAAGCRGRRSDRWEVPGRLLQGRSDPSHPCWTSQF